ncbi:MAG TPA: NADH-quinone oxidoreductase subunit C [Vicinamibacteria bacterium]|nr:NADH-quinone oxidoreductase subunit C [Vicinamibacteria bacterium]
MSLATLAEILALPPGSLREPRPGELRADVETGALRAVADRLASGLGARLASLFATDEREWNGVYALHQVWLLPRHRTFLGLSARVDPAHPRFPSIAAKHPAANWFEREVMDAFGLFPEGHPNPSRVSLHDDWPDGAWVLRKDFPDDAKVPRVEGAPHPFRPVTGEGVFQVPVGPVHAGIIEPGHFRFGVAGEPVLYLQLRLFYVHKGTEKRFERLPWRHGIFLAESISGDTAVGHALAFAHAIERLTGSEPPPRARHLRVVLLELERVYNHLADIGAIATDVAFAVPAAHAQLLRERLVSLQERLFGSRLLRGTVAVGGVKGDLPARGREELRAHLVRLKADFESLVTLLIDSGSFTDRVDGTGVLPKEAARDLGVVGLAARASGLDEDLRRDHPHDAYGTLRFEVPVEEGGDVRARLMLRAREVEQSLAILDQALATLPDSPLRTPPPAELPAFSAALGWAEGWRGPCLHWVETDARGALTRVKVTDPSFRNWPGLARAVPGNIIPDFPVINKSFNLSYSGNDH